MSRVNCPKTGVGLDIFHFWKTFFEKVLDFFEKWEYNDYCIFFGNLNWVKVEEKIFALTIKVRKKFFEKNFILVDLIRFILKSIRG